MAQYHVNLAFTADTAKAKAQMQELQKQLTNLINSPQTQLNIEGDLQGAVKAAAELKSHLQAATNVRTGNLDFAKFNQAITQSGKSLDQYANQLRSLGPTGQQAFMALANSVANAEIPIKRTNALLEKFKDTMANTIRWQISSNIMHGFESALSSAYGYAQDLNKSLTDIRIVTGQNTDQMASFAKEANKAAKALSTTTTDYTNASLIYYQQGLTDAEVKERTDITIKMANVARASAEDVSDQLTAVWNNFYDGTQTLEYYADVMTALGAATASSTDEISEGLNKFASVAETVGLSYEYAAAALATVTSTTRESADVVGNAFKTLFARIQGLQLGETLEDGTTLNKYSQALADVGIDIKTVNGDIKDMDTILNELGAKWTTLAKDQQIALAQTVAGVRQYTQLVALMDNWTYFQENLGVVADSEGALQEQADIYAESWEAAQKRVTTAAQGIYDSLINDEFFIDLLNGLEKVLTFVDNLIDGLGGLEGVLTAIGTLLTKIMSDQLSQGLTNMVYNIKMSTKAGREAIRQERENFLRQAAEDMHQEDDDLAPVDRLRSEQMQDQIKLQASLTEKAEQMSAFELTTNQNLLDRVKILSEANIKAQEGLELAKAQKAATVEDIRTSMTSRWMNTYGTNNDTANQQGLNNLYTNFGIQERNLEQIAKIRSIFDQVQASGKLTTEQIQSMSVAFGQVQGTSHTTLKGIFDGLTAIDGPGDELNNSLDNIRIAFNLLFSEAQQKLTGTNLGFELTTEQFNALYQNILRTEVAQQGAIGTTRQYKDGVDGLTKSINNARGAQKQWADYIVSASNAIFGISSIINNLGGIIDTLSNPDISGWEKFTTILSTVAILIPTIISAVSSLKEIFNLETLAKLANTAATWAQVQAETELARKKERSENSTEGNTNATKKNTFAKIKDALTTNKQQRIDTWNTNALAGSKRFVLNKETGKYLDTKSNALISKEFASKIAGQEATTALKGMAKGLGLIAAAIAVVGVTIAGVTAYINKEKEAAERAIKSAQDLKQAYEDAKSEYNNLLSTIENYRTAADSITTLTKGTDEFKDAVIEANDQALALINTYDELADQYTITADGLIQFNAGVLDNIANLQRQQMLTAQSASIAANAVAKDRNLEYENTEFNRDIRSTGDIWMGAGNTAVSTTIGAGAGVLAGAGVAAIAAKIGGAIGTAITPGIGTAVGAGIGAVVGLIAGAVTSGIEGSETGEEEKVLTELAELAKQEGQEDLWTYDNLKTALDGLTDDSGLKEALLEDISATRAQIEAINANTEAQLAYTQLLTSNAMIGQEAYDSSNYKDLISYYGATDVGSYLHTQASNQMEGYTDWWWGNEDFWNEYLRLQYGADANQYRVTDTWGNEATLMRQTTDGWVEVGKVYEDVAREQAINLRAAEMAAANTTQYAERANTLIGNLENLGLANENATDYANLQNIAIAFESGQDIDLSGYSRSEIIELSNNLDNASGSYTSLAGTDLETELREAINDWAENRATANIQASSEWLENYESNQAADLQKTLADAGMDEKGFENLVKTYSAFGDEAEDVAKRVLKTSNAVKNLSDVFEDNVDALDPAMEGTAAYAQAVGEVQTTLEDWLGVDLGYEYVAENLDLIRKAAEGDTEALKDLQLQAAREIVIQMDLPEEQALQFNNIIDQIDAREISVGTSIDELDLTGFIASMNEMLRAGQITAEQANAYLNSIGFDPDIDYDTVQQDETVGWTYNGPFGTLNGTFTTHSTIKVPVINAEGTTYTGGANTITPAMTGGGSSGGGGGNTKKDYKVLDDEKERYYEINEALDDLAKKLDLIDKKKSRAFGKAKSDLIKQEIAVIDEEIEKTDDLIRAIEQDIPNDMANLAAFGATFDENNNITNYDEIYAAEVAKYNAAVATGDEATIAAAEERWNLFEKYLEQYEATMDAYDDAIAQQTDNKIKKYEKLFEDLTYTIQVDLDIEEDQIKLLDHLLTMLEDESFSAAEAIGLLGQKTQATLNQASIYAQGITDLLNLHGLDEETIAGVLSGAISPDALVDEYGFSDEDIAQLREYMDGLMSSSEALMELRNTVQEKVIETFREWNEEMDRGIAKIEHLTGVIDAYQNIVELVGQETLGLDADFMKNMANAKVSTSQDAFVANKAKYDAAVEARKKAEEEYQAAVARGDDASAKQWQKTINELDTEVQNAHDAMLDSWQSTLEAAQEAFEIAVDQTIDTFEKAISGTFGSLEALQQAFDQQSEIIERFVDDYEKIYELSKLNRDITNSIDVTSNVKAKQALRDLQEEINELQESDVQMSEYDLSYLRKKYELRLAEIALEEAQNAKSQVRMRKDSEGNYSYVFTADEANIEAARQNYEDKLYEMQELNTEYIKEMQNNIIQSEIELANALRALDRSKYKSDAEYYAEVDRITAYYMGQRTYYLGELDKGLQNNQTTYSEDWYNYSQYTGYKISADDQYIDNFNETVYAQLTGYQSIEDAQNQFKAATKVMVEDLRTAFINWQNAVKTTMEAAGTSIEDFGKTTEDTLEQIVYESGEAAQEVTEDAEEFVDAFGVICDEVTEWQETYSLAIDEAIDSNTAMVDSCSSLIDMLSDVDSKLSGTGQQFATTAAAIEAAAARIQAAADAAAAAASSVGSGNGGGYTPPSTSDGETTGGEYKEDTNPVIEEEPYSSVPPSAFNVGQRLKTKEKFGFITRYLKSGNAMTSSGSWGPAVGFGIKLGTIQDKFYYGGQWYYKVSGTDMGWASGWLKGLQAESYDTGGYTGQWGSDGRLAMLHQKELVLNASDTENMLQIVDIVRDIAKVIDLGAGVQSTGLGYLASSSVQSNEQLIEQQVTIHAEFPNAVDHSEIEEAFDTLINRASQFANRKNK